MNFPAPLRTALLLAALAAPVTAQAENRWYAGAAYSRVSGEFVDMSYGSQIGYGPQSSDDGFKVIGGLRPLDWLAIEANYSDLGTTDGTLGFICIDSPCPVHFSTNAKAFSVSAQGLYSIGRVDLLARLGLARWSADYHWINDDGSHFVTRDRLGTDAVWGLGAQLNFRNVTTRLEFENLELDRDTIETLSLGLTYWFR